MEWTFIRVGWVVQGVVMVQALKHVQVTVENMVVVVVVIILTVK
jgi:hypothetical protein